MAVVEEEYAWDYNPEKYLPKNTYTPAHLRATQKYREKHREKYNEYQKNYHLKKMRTDLDYRNRRAISSEKAAAKRKLRLQEARKAKEEHDLKMICIVKEETGIEQKINNIIQIDNL